MISINDGCRSAFQIASCLTDPVCRAHESFWRARIVDAAVRKCFLYLAAVSFAVLALFTTLPGVALRGAAARLQNRPFLFEHGAAAKSLPESKIFTLLSWNICCVAGGYPITDGGVAPWRDRIDRVIDQIVSKDADVNCLYETFDTAAAMLIAEKLKERGYAHIYYNIGPKAIGLSSGILVASKYKIDNPEFDLFPQDSLVGRTKNAAKGVFAFDLASRGGNFVRIFATHLQHSEEPQFPTPEEIKARRKQMEIIVSKVDQARGKCLVVTGDLNLDDREFAVSSWQGGFDRGEPFPGETWCGDASCARLVGKRVSGPLNLDHTMFARGTAQWIATVLAWTAGYDPSRFQGLSDHEGLFSWIKVRSA